MIFCKEKAMNRKKTKDEEFLHPDTEKFWGA